MPDFNGLDFIRSLKNPPKIILITSDPNFAIEAFEYDSIIDYLLKPIELPRFIKAVQKVENHLSIAHRNTEDIKNKNDFYVNIDRRLIKIDLHKIYIIEANGDYINIRTCLLYTSDAADE